MIEKSLKAFLENIIMNGCGINEIARKTGLPSSTISRIVNGKAIPNIVTVQKILKPFEYTLSINKIGLEPLAEKGGRDE